MTSLVSGISRSGTTQEDVGIAVCVALENSVDSVQTGNIVKDVYDFYQITDTRISPMTSARLVQHC